MIRGAVSRACTAAALVSGAQFALIVGNALVLRRPAPPDLGGRRLAVLVPARDEAGRIGAIVRDVLAQRGVELTLWIGDDGSSDGTADVARAAADGDPRCRVVRLPEPPPGATGKAAACAALADLAFVDGADVFVFVDADVRLDPGVLASLRLGTAALLSAWPAQLAVTALGRLVQPLLAWSWLSTVPLFLPVSRRHPAMAVANGQLLVVDADAYRAVGGHRAVAASPTEDLAIARLLRRAGHTTDVRPAAGASCRMYDDDASLREGYGRWLHQAFGRGGVLVPAIVAATQLTPWLATAAGHRPSLLAAALQVAGRIVARRVEHAPVGFAPPAHPASIVTALGLYIDAHRRRGRRSWKGRPMPASDR